MFSPLYITRNVIYFWRVRTILTLVLCSLEFPMRIRPTQLLMIHWCIAFSGFLHQFYLLRLIKGVRVLCDGIQHTYIHIYNIEIDKRMVNILLKYIFCLLFHLMVSVSHWFIIICLLCIYSQICSSFFLRLHFPHLLLESFYVCISWYYLDFYFCVFFSSDIS